MPARRMIGRATIFSILLAPVTACTGPSLVLLDDETGGSGAVAVLETKGQPGETVIDKTNTRTRLSRVNPASKPLGGRGLSDEERALVAFLPPEPTTFIMYFIEGTTRPAPGSENVIEQVRAQLEFRPGAEVEVTGHTDTVGSDDDNDRLSQQRAIAVANALVEQGFDADMISAVARGERQLLVPTADNVANAANRRVEIVVR